MVISDLVKCVKESKIIGDKSTVVTGLAMHDDFVENGFIYFCIKGSKFDGEQFVKSAIAKGASVIVSEEEVDCDVTQVIVPSIRKAMSVMSGEFYGNPAKKLKLIGVTGTNGKTTTCHIIRNILRCSGVNVGLIGTLGVFYNNVSIAPELTTPDPIFLHKIFADMYCAGVEYVVMEVSAHAIALDKIEGLKFEVGVFTNFTQDHLDFFGSMENYALAKQKFLTPTYCDFTVFNTDDELGCKLFLKAGIKSASYGIDNPSDVFAVNIKEEISGVSFVMNIYDNIYNVKCKMAGLFSVYNVLAASTCAAVLNVDFDDILNGIKLTEGVSGRIECVKNCEDKNIFIDYAHTPDGLKNVLSTLRKCTKGKLVCLFGCGGNRDKEKRSIMGEIAGKYADFSVITSDNPRYEEPCDIILEIEKGIRKNTDKYITIQDRKKAILYAVGMIGAEDVLLIAGKGAEEYQEVLGVRHQFNDKKVVENILRGN